MDETEKARFAQFQSNNKLFGAEGTHIFNRDVEIHHLKVRIAFLENELLIAKSVGALDRENYVSLKEAAEVVAKILGTKISELRSNRRGGHGSFNRQVLMYIACIHTKLSTSIIGKYLNKDHTTVMHGRDKIAKLIESDPDVAKLIHSISEKLDSLKFGNN